MTEPQNNPPPPLDYQRPAMAMSSAPTIPGRTLVLRFFAGLVLGAALSAIIWITGWKPLTQRNDGSGMVWAILIVPSVKLIAGIVLLCFRGWRLLGAGILVSIAIGAMIFFGVCARNL